MRRYSRISAYVMEEFLLSFLVAFLFFFFIFFINQLLVMAEEIFSKKVPFFDVVLFIIFSLPAIVALAFPFGSLVGALMAVGRLSSDNELMALKASGVPLRRVFLPLFLAALALSALSFTMNDYFLPLGNLQLGRIYRKILYTNPAIELEPYAVKRYENTVIITGGVTENRIENVLIIDRTAENQKRITVAKRALLEEGGNQRGVLSLRLSEVFVHEPSAKDRGQFAYTTAGTMIYNLLLKDFNVSFMNPGPREMSSPDVWREIQGMQKELDKKRQEQLENTRRALYSLGMEARYLRDTAAENREALAEGLKGLAGSYQSFGSLKRQRPTDRSLQLYRLEFNKKFSVPLACVVFIVFAFPVGLFARKSGRSVGFGIGLLVSTLYWGLLFTGQTLGLRLELAPFPAMWLPNFIILLLGAGLSVFRPGR